jgi:hypothetical protein
VESGCFAAKIMDTATPNPDIPEPVVTDDPIRILLRDTPMNEGGTITNTILAAGIPTGAPITEDPVKIRVSNVSSDTVGAVALAAGMPTTAPSHSTDGDGPPKIRATAASNVSTNTPWLKILGWLALAGLAVIAGKRFLSKP